MSNYGLKWAKEGVPVETAGAEDLIIDSSNPMLKIRSIGSGTVTYAHDGGETDVLIASHNLGYNPLILFLTQTFEIDEGEVITSFSRAPIFESYLGSSMFFRAVPYVNTSQLRFRVESYSGFGGKSVSLKYVYVIYYDPDES